MINPKDTFKVTLINFSKVTCGTNFQPDLQQYGYNLLKALCKTRINKVESPFQISQNMEYSKILNFNKVDDKRLNIVKPLSNVFKQIISKFMKDIESNSLPNYSNLKNYLI